ncbi:MAG TPA: poly-gamma-glutamate biosynthesis protein PgsC/CapC, partial [Planctomycetaceae bacterium]|nr:poly-gamma-glutamate biosynthesis protein PgsC/CapC [Planctomycetaceae bacterium]
VVRGLARLMIVYGKRRTTLMILVGFAIGVGVRAILDALPASETPGALQPTDFAVVGFIIPGLLAIWIDRQGLAETLCTSLTAGCLARLVLIICAVEGIA